MTELEVLHWLSVISMARNGNEEMANYLQAENSIRQEQGRPSVEEELREIAEIAERQKDLPEKPRERWIVTGD